MYRCLCDCGKEVVVAANNLRTGKQVSCGCYNDENRSRIHSKDLSGKRFGTLSVLRQAGWDESNGKRFRLYECLCDCGKTVTVRGANLTSGNTASCGDVVHKHTNLEDITGNCYQYCRVIERAPVRFGPSGQQKTFWKCQCICGNTFEAWAITIKKGNANCGCKRINSIGEETIKTYLNNLEIPYIQEYAFDDLKYINPLRFDFALVKDQKVIALIEFQGEQHAHEVKNSIVNFGLKQRTITDPMKREYCN